MEDSFTTSQTIVSTLLSDWNQERDPIQYKKSEC